MSNEFTKEKKIIEYIDAHPTEEYSLDALCRRFETNRTTLGRAVKALTGCSPMQYVTKKRLEASCADLLSCDDPIALVAERWGFGDPNYYIRAFGNLFGVSPYQYRLTRKTDRVVYNVSDGRAHDMSIAEFEEYLQKGLGRAIILLRASNKKSEYRRAVINDLTEGKRTDTLGGEYEKELSECFEAPGEESIKEIVAKKLLSNLKIDGDTSKLSTLIALGYGKEAKKTVEENYDYSYNKLVEFNKTNTEANNTFIYTKMYDGAVRALICAASLDYEKAKKIVLDIADIFALRDDAFIPSYYAVLSDIRLVLGEDKTDKLCADIAEKHPKGEKIASDMNMLNEHGGMPKLPATWDNLLNPRKPIPFMISDFAGSDEAFIREVAEKILDEKEEMDIRLRLIELFCPIDMPEFPTPPKFPLDPTPIVEIARREEKTYEPPVHMHKMPPIGKLWWFLSAAEGDAVRDYGLEMLANPATKDSLLEYAFEMVYGANYRPEDEAVLVKRLYSEDETERFDAQSAIMRAAKSGKNISDGALIEAFLTCYHLSPTKLELANMMISRPSAMALIGAELALDAASDIREMAKSV